MDEFNNKSGINNSFYLEDGYNQKNAERNSNFFNKKKNKNADFMKLISLFIVAVVAVTIFILPLVNNTSNIIVNLNELSLSSNSVLFDVTVDNSNSNDNISVRLYNDFTNRNKNLNFDGGIGVFENLAENMIYTLEVKNNNRVLLSKKVRTTKEKQTKLFSVEYDFSSAVKTLKINFIDDFNYWSDFTMCIHYGGKIYYKQSLATEKLHDVITLDSFSLKLNNSYELIIICSADSNYVGGTVYPLDTTKTIIYSKDFNT